MAALSETRDIGSPLPLPGAVRRLCCIGDSITYGQGVAPDETLAMHLARFANAAYPHDLVWVDNLGQSSGNIWHSWTSFRRLSESIRYEAAIFSLCQNDAQIFEGNSVQYGDDVVKTWLTDGELTPIVRRTLGEIAEVARRGPTRIIVTFYTMWDGDAPIIEALARECRKIGLPFMDLLRFLKEQSGLSTAEFIASPFDGHPSGNGHRAVARHIVTELKKHWEPPTASGDLSERLVEACDQAVNAGWPPEGVFHWASVVLDAKDTIARRLWFRRLWKRGEASLGDLPAARQAVQDRYRKWYGERLDGARTRLFDERRDELHLTLERTFATIRNLDELTFALEHFQESDTAAGVWRLLDVAGYYNEKERLQPLPNKPKQQLISATERASTAGPDSAEPEMRQFRQMRQDFADDARRLATLLPDGAQPADLDANLLKLWQVAFYLVSSAETYFRELDTIISGMQLGLSEQPPFFTGVDLWIERDQTLPKRAGSYNLTVEVDYREPRRARHTLKLWGGAEADHYHYHFVVPLVLLGDVAVGVPEWDAEHKRFLSGELRIAKVEIRNSRGPSPKGEGFSWTPPAGHEPTHWLRFNQLVIP